MKENKEKKLKFPHHDFSFYFFKVVLVFFRLFFWGGGGGGVHIDNFGSLKGHCLN
jgi:hypothetical protein